MSNRTLTLKIRDWLERAQQDIYNKEPGTLMFTSIISITHDLRTIYTRSIVLTSVKRINIIKPLVQVRFI